MASSISVPPRVLSPEVEITSKTPLSISIIVTSNVPPPKSKTAAVYSPSLSSP